MEIYWSHGTGKASSTLSSRLVFHCDANPRKALQFTNTHIPKPQRNISKSASDHISLLMVNNKFSHPEKNQPRYNISRSGLESEWKIEFVCY